MMTSKENADYHDKIILKRESWDPSRLSRETDVKKAIGGRKMRLKSSSCNVVERTGDELLERHCALASRNLEPFLPWLDRMP